ncbi:hypothetical protein Lal_00021991, partial [Lupinus albus]
VTGLWDGSTFDWVFQPSIGKSGGLLCIWKKDVFQKIAHRNGKGFLGVIDNDLASRELCYIINVYSPCNYKEKREVWLELGQWKNESSCNMWCIIGDFNSVKSSEERKGRESHGRLKEMRNFNGFINNLALIDLPLVGRRFTWIKGDGRTMSRLDRFLITSNWAKKWPSFIQKGLQRLVSDHCAVVLLDSNLDWGPKPFRKKLRMLKSFLKVWNKEHFRIIDTKIDLAAAGIHQLDLKDESQGLTDAENVHHSTPSADMWHARYNQPDSWEWKHDKSKLYTVQSAYKLITHTDQQQNNNNLLSSLFWKSKAPLKVLTFVWRLFQDKIPTKDALLKRGITMQEGGDHFVSSITSIQNRSIIFFQLVLFPI